QRAPLHLRGRAQHPQRPIRRRSEPGRPELPLLHLPDLLPSLPAPPLSGPGDPRRPPRHLAQPHLLLRSDGRGAAADRGGQLRRMVGKMARRPPSSPTGKPRRDPSRLTRATFSRPKEPVAVFGRTPRQDGAAVIFWGRE